MTPKICKIGDARTCMEFLRVWVLTYFLAMENHHKKYNHPLLNMVQTYKGTDDIEIEKLTKNHAFYNLVKKIHKKNISSNIMDEERYLKLIKVCETNKGCHNKLQAFQINKLYRQEFK